MQLAQFQMKCVFTRETTVEITSLLLKVIGSTFEKYVKGLDV